MPACRWTWWVAEGQNAFDFLNGNPSLFPGTPRYLLGNVGHSGLPAKGTAVSVEEDIPAPPRRC